VWDAGDVGGGDAAASLEVSDSASVPLELSLLCRFGMILKVYGVVWSVLGMREAIAAHQDIHRTASKSDPELDAKFHTALVQMYSLLALSVSRWWITLARARVHELARTMVSRHKSKKYFLPAEERLRRHPFLGRQQAFSITDPWWIM
jgi:hypothetical protein